MLLIIDKKKRVKSFLMILIWKHWFRHTSREGLCNTHFPPYARSFQTMLKSLSDNFMNTHKMGDNVISFFLCAIFNRPLYVQPLEWCQVPCNEKKNVLSSLSVKRCLHFSGNIKYLILSEDKIYIRRKFLIFI